MMHFNRRCFTGLVLLLSLGSWSTVQATVDSMDAMDPALIRERIKPVGEVNVAPAALPPASASTANSNLQTTAPLSSSAIPTATPSTTVPTGPAATGNGGQVSLAIGENIFNSKCTVCHTPGIAGAPKVGDVVAWKPRIAKGMDTLLLHVTNGFNAMPPKGTCLECSESDLKSALQYIVSRAQ